MKRLALIALLPLAACDAAPDSTLQGYGEAQYLYVASQDGGPLAELLVTEGDTVAAGTVLFRTDASRLQMALDGAEATAAAARARTDPSGALAEAVRQAEANAELARRNLKRTEQLVADGNAPRSRLDADRAALKSAEAAVAGAKAERDSAQRDVGAAEAAAALARRRVADAAVAAPAAGTVERIYRRPGEMLNPGAPVLALLPPEAMKIRFFVPEPSLAAFAVGRQVALSCDGCPDGLTASITYVAAEPQFTPPVIYSLEERAKLVFLAEARPDRPEAIRPGLPVDVEARP